jgi:hypothetical protein
VLIGGYPRTDEIVPGRVVYVVYVVYVGYVVWRDPDVSSYSGPIAVGIDEKNSRAAGTGLPIVTEKTLQSRVV